jgi:hypothetical protein
METYLFTWVPENYKELYDDYKSWLANGSVDVADWSSGSNQSIPSEARAFFMAQKAERRGIFARGQTTSRTKPGTPPNAYDNNVRIEEFSDPDNPLITAEQLLKIFDKPKGPYFRSSGIKISENIAAKLEVAWPKAWTNRQSGV